MPVSISGTNGVTFPDSSLQAAAASPYVLKNRIINGAMVIDQRNAGASVTQLASVVYGVDRWYTFGTVTSKFTAQQNAGSVTPPADFKNYWGITSSSSYTPGTSEQFIIAQGIEGYNIADLNYGTANAKTVTLSFWVRSSLTGTFAGGVGNSANNRSYSFNYTISAANTWEQKTITITGDTTGTWDSTNGGGMYVNFSMGTGSTFQSTANTWAAGNFKNVSGAVNVVGTNGATFYITGVQLEIGTSATPFERRLYNQELANCQRYCQRWTGNGISTQAIIAMGMQTSTTGSVFNVQTAVPMRATPTITFSSLIVSDSIGFDAAASIVGIDAYASTSSYVGVTHASAGASNRPVRLSPGAASTGFFNFSAEL